MTVWLTVHFVSFVAFAGLVVTAPEGYEDGRGFHYGSR